MRTLLLFIVLFISTATLRAQQLDFLGLKGIYFGMKSADMPDKTVILDSTSSYKDTATYLRNTRCKMYFRKNENLSLAGFTASRVEYEFCDNELGYVFVYVKGNTEIDKAIAQLQLTFRKLGCKGKPASQCTLMDASAKGMRVIVNIDRKKQEMNFVLIPKKPAK